MSFSTFLEIPDDSTAYADGDWNRVRGWMWRCEIGPRFGDNRLTFAFEKTHREDGTTLFLSTFHDGAGTLAERVKNHSSELPEQLAEEIVSRLLTMAGSVRAPEHVGKEMRDHLSAWIRRQRARTSEPGGQFA